MKRVEKLEVMGEAEIGRALGIGPSVVKMRLKRGREALRQDMEGNT